MKAADSSEMQYELMLIMQGLMMLTASMLVLVPLVVTVVCYFLSRAEEKRSGEVLFAGKSAVIFTLMNNAAWLFFVACTMICFNIIGDMETSYNFETDKSEKGWEVLRMGLALLVTSGLSLLVLSVLWRNWTVSSELLPRDNIFVKCFSGINMFVLSGLAISLGTSILFLLLEAMASDKVKIDELGDAFKLPVVALICTLAFLAINIRLFGSCSDRAPLK